MTDSNVLDDFVNKPADDDENESDWEDENDEFERNAFDFIIDDEV